MSKKKEMSGEECLEYMNKIKEQNRKYIEEDLEHYLKLTKKLLSVVCPELNNH